MRIGLLTSVGPMLDAFFPEIVQEWEAAGHTVLTAAGDGAKVLSGTVIEGLTRRPAISARRAQRALRAWSEEGRLDVVVTNSATASALVRTAGLRMPVVYFCHGLHWNRLRTPQDHLWQTVEHQLLARTAGVLTLNSDDEAWFRRRMPTHAVHRLRPGVGLDLEQYPRTALPAGPLSLAWIGEHSRRKRPWLAVDVAAGLRAAGTDATLTLVGVGSLLERTRSEVRRRGLEDIVHVVGWADAAQTLAGAHALIHTAAWEGLPRVMLEAFAMGRRTYAFDVKGVRDSPDAILLEDEDVAGMADAVAGDWASGLLHRPVEADAGHLCSKEVAQEILVFLRGAIVPVSAGATEAAAGSDEGRAEAA
ncbi:glycosyltransferase [Brevibacterium jeotgali]|uniref:Glycosyltransferase involved in cell wall bisynthesis n=1 Tax=Brevibacterium jeotgali TaxID=1262550 RepID=A0A2H1L3A7_9MICO|nr:glycosyltransferase [Brevibacterium jeotgali]TWC01639.1 glycosyltransferase involved in cell wall biosynthesis [Brevibacterium jeotgali]SMY11384.1 Glycosyltransferase involved in cell wall bisynthesis [Brevibacterium jeotgali]